MLSVADADLSNKRHYGRLKLFLLKSDLAWAFLTFKMMNNNEKNTFNCPIGM